MLAEHDKLAREATARGEPYDAYLLRLTELEVAARTANAIAARIRAAGVPVAKDFDTFDFTAVPALPRQKVLELARGEWVGQRWNCCLIGGSGTGKTHLATALGLALCRAGKRVRFVTAAGLVTELEEAQQQHRLDRLLTALDRLDLLIVDELGYLSFSRAGAELLFQVFADRYERRSLLVTSNPPFGEWGTVFQGERMTAVRASVCDGLGIHPGGVYRLRRRTWAGSRPPRIMASWAGVTASSAPAAAGKANVPRSSRRRYRANPSPCQASTFSRSPLRFLNTNSSPDAGSRPRAAVTTPASPSMPLRPSCGSTARKMAPVVPRVSTSHPAGRLPAGRRGPGPPIAAPGG